MAEAVTYADLRFVKVPQKNSQHEESSEDYKLEEFELMYENVDNLKPHRENVRNSPPEDSKQCPPIAKLQNWSPLLLVLSLLCSIFIGSTIGIIVKYVHVSMEVQQMYKNNVALKSNLSQKIQTREDQLTEYIKSLEKTKQELEEVLRGRNRFNSSLQECHQAQKISSNRVNELEGLNKKINEEKEQTAQSLEKIQTSVKACQQECNSGWTIVSGRCLFFSEVQKSWWDSYINCGSKGSSLLILKNEDLKKKISKKNKSYWIGLRNYANKPTWVDGTEEINVSLGNNRCGVFDDSKIYPEECWRQKYWICEKKICCFLF